MGDEIKKDEQLVDLMNSMYHCITEFNKDSTKDNQTQFIQISETLIKMQEICIAMYYNEPDRNKVANSISMNFSKQLVKRFDRPPEEMSRIIKPGLS